MQSDHARLKRVYPRGCGGALLRPPRRCPFFGLSPRVRGSRRSPALGEQSVGSIPAGAGEPAAVRSATGNAEVYPRGCGGAENRGIDQLARFGLSPRVRGSRCAKTFRFD